MPDAAPEIAFAEPPAATHRGVLRSHFQASDDYGVASIALLLARPGEGEEPERIELMRPAGGTTELDDSVVSRPDAAPLGRSAGDRPAGGAGCARPARPERAPGAGPAGARVPASGGARADRAAPAPGGRRPRSARRSRRRSTRSPGRRDAINTTTRSISPSTRRCARLLEDARARANPESGAASAGRGRARRTPRAKPAGSQPEPGQHGEQSGRTEQGGQDQQAEQAQQSAPAPQNEQTRRPGRGPRSAVGHGAAPRGRPPVAGRARAARAAGGAAPGARARARATRSSSG